MELYYCHPSGITPPIITLDTFESRHMVTTMRKKVGETVTVTDGAGHAYRCTISETRKNVLLHIDGKENIHPRKGRVALAIGYIRPARLELVLEKGTELGVTDFYLMRSRYSNYKGSNTGRYEKYLRQAIKQSLHYFLPTLHLVKDISALIKETEDYDLRIAAIAAGATPIQHFLEKNTGGAESNILLAIGPEGGFSEDEITIMHKTGFKRGALGAYRLRAETAAIAGIALITLSLTPEK